jgi:hypothetical protein
MHRHRRSSPFVYRPGWLARLCSITFICRSLLLSITVTATAQPPGAFSLVSPEVEPSGVFRLSIQGTPGRTYVIQRSNALQDAGSWTDEATLVNVSGTVSYSGLLEPGATATYFRARLVP